jgi:hypothetical protein
MTPLSYRMVGQYDQLFQIDIRPDGSYQLETGSYRSASPQRGTLTPEQQAGIERLAASLTGPFPPDPGDADGFVSELVLNPGRDAEVIRWWGRLTDPTTPLAQLTGLLRSLG